MAVTWNISFLNYSGGPTVPAGTIATFYALGVDVTTATAIDTQTVLASSGSVSTSKLLGNTFYQVSFNNSSFFGPYQFMTPGVGTQSFSIPTPASSPVSSQSEARPLYDVVTIQSPSLTGGKLSGTLFSNYANTSTVSLLSLSNGIFTINVPSVLSGFQVWQMSLRGYISGTANATTSANIQVWAEAPNTTLITIPASSVNLCPAVPMTNGQPATQTVEIDLVFRNVVGAYNFSIRPQSFSAVSTSTLFVNFIAL